MTAEISRVIAVAVATAGIWGFTVAHAPAAAADGLITKPSDSGVPAWVTERLGEIRDKDGGGDRRIVYVDDDNTSGPWDGTLEHPYQHIQDGIDNSEAGDVVAVWSGDYYEQVVVDRSIALVGEEVATTIVQDNEWYVVVEIAADGVWFSGFTVTSGSDDPDCEGIDITADSCTVVGNSVVDTEVGIGVYEASYSSVRDNYMTNAGDNCSVCVSSASHNVIQGNTLVGGDQGIVVTVESSDNAIVGNIISDHSLYGIRLRDATGNTVSENTINGNRNGLRVDQASGNTISDNAFMDNRFDGISVEESTDLVMTGNMFAAGGGISLHFYGYDPEVWSTQTIEGNVIDGEPIYFYKNASGVTVPGDAAQVILADCDGCVIEGLTLDKARNPIQVGGSTNVTVRDNTITTHWYCNGIVLAGSSGCTIEGNQLDSDYTVYVDGDASGIAGMHIEAGSENTVSSNVITGFHEGVVLWHSDASHDNLITGNTIASFQTGITLWQNHLMYCYGDVISDNMVIGCDRNGVSVYHVPRITITGNQFVDTGLTLSGDDVDYWSGHTITGNTVNGKPLYYFDNQVGVVVPEDAGQVILADCPGFIADNLVIEGASNGITGAFCPNATVSNCVIEDAGSAGIRLSYSPYSTCIGNVLSGCARAISVGDDCDYAVISANVVAESTRVGIYSSDSNYVSIVNNIVTETRGAYAGYTGHGMHVFRTSESTISGNTITCCDDIGMWVGDYSYGNLITVNTVSRSGRRGVHVYHSSGNEIYQNDFVANQVNASEYSSPGNLWCQTGVGNFWSDFEENPGYPNYYEIPGDDDGVDWDPLESVFACPFSPGDIDGSCGDVDFADFEAFVECWDLSPDDCGDYGCSDLDGDGAVDLADFAIFSLLYGTMPVNTPPGSGGE